MPNALPNELRQLYGHREEAAATRFCSAAPLRYHLRGQEPRQVGWRTCRGVLGKAEGGGREIMVGLS